MPGKWVSGLTGLLIAVVMAGGLGACGDSTIPSNQAVAPETAAATAGASASRAASISPVNPGLTPSRGTATVAVAAEPSLTEEVAERTVIRTFKDLEGRPVKLVYGRGRGRGGDYGWAHIYGKHVQGIWYDGGTITTFPKALGTKTPQEVVDLIARSLQDKKPDEAGNNRRSYVYQVPGTNRDVFTVVGGDGTIITSYPVPRGSKDNDF